MQEVFERLMLDLGAEYGRLMLFDAKTNTLACHQVFNLPHSLPGAVETVEPQHPGAKAIKKCCTVVENTTNGFMMPFATPKNISSSIATPLRASNMILGVLEAYSVQSEHLFTDTDIQKLEAAAATMVGFRKRTQ